jgi:hypothetical protein
MKRLRTVTTALTTAKVPRVADADGQETWPPSGLITHDQGIKAARAASSDDVAVFVVDCAEIRAEPLRIREVSSRCRREDMVCEARAALVSFWCRSASNCKTHRDRADGRRAAACGGRAPL